MKRRIMLLMAVVVVSAIGGVPLENEDKAYGALHDRIVERICLWPATGPNAKGGDGAEMLPEFKFDTKTPPMFLVHGDRDYYSPMGSVRIYEELHRRKIPAQLFVYANVSHWLGNTPNVKGWQQRIVDWIESIGY